MKLPKLKRWEPVRVEWLDSRGADTGWTDADLDDETRQIEGFVTVGMVHSYRPDRLTLALSHDTTAGNIAGHVTIPTVAITAVRRLDKQGRKARKGKHRPCPN